MAARIELSLIDTGRNNQVISAVAIGTPGAPGGTWRMFFDSNFVTLVSAVAAFDAFAAALVPR